MTDIQQREDATQPMSLIDYGRIALRRGWIMLLLAGIAALSAYVLSSQQTPQYRATQFVLMQPSRSDLGLADGLLRQMNSYQVYLYSTERAQEVIDALRLDLLAGALLAETQIASNRDNLTIQIDVTLPDPAMAASVARAWGGLMVEYRNLDNQRLLQDQRVNALLPDQPTVGLDSPRPMIAAVAGAIIGLVLGGVIVFVLEYLESSIVRRRDDVERALELPVLAIIPE